MCAVKPDRRWNEIVDDDYSMCISQHWIAYAFICAWPIASHHMVRSDSWLRRRRWRWRAPNALTPIYRWASNEIMDYWSRIDYGLVRSRPRPIPRFKAVRPAPSITSLLAIYVSRHLKNNDCRRRFSWNFLISTAEKCVGSWINRRRNFSVALQSTSVSLEIQIDSNEHRFFIFFFVYPNKFWLLLSSISL